jgi:amino acid adenylation domain-containing protein/non-ribosomal peptide synthase protein (TIGR01720 family)
MDVEIPADIIEDIYELSPMQEGILFHSVFAPQSMVYREGLSLRLQGELDEQAFERAWQRVVDRHGILRTAFLWEGLEKPLQVVFRRVQAEMQKEDWRHLSDAEQGASLAAYVRRDRQAGFDLSAAPLMRLSLIRLQPQTYAFIWSFHHILLDGWSLPLLMQEVGRCYEALRQGKIREEAERRPYRDYIAWLQQQDMGAAERFWRQRLQGFTKPTPHVAAGRHRGDPAANEDYAERELCLRQSLTEALHEAGQRQQLTLNTLVQGAWGLLLSRYSGEEDVIFGVTMSGRPPQLAGVENMLGLFINTLPMRVAAEGEAQVGGWLEELQRQQVRMQEYVYSPLVKVQGWSEMAAGQRLFETLLVFENYPIGKAGEAGGVLRISDVSSYDRNNFPLSLGVTPGSEIKLKLIYDCGRWEEAGVERLLNQLENLLAGLVSGKQHRLKELELLTPAERRQLLVEWNDTHAEYPEDRCIHELFEDQARQQPDVVAVVCEGRHLTYGELNGRSNRLAHHLRQWGVGAELRVGICAQRSPEMVIGVLGVLKAGGAYVPLDPSYPLDRLSTMIEDAQLPVLLTQQDQLARMPIFGGLVLSLDADWKVIAEASDENPPNIACACNIAYAIYTSGSAGRPKGVLVPHRALCSLAKAQALAFGLQRSDRVLQFASLSFDASVWEMVQAFTTGASLCLVKDPGVKLIETLEEQAITIATIPPSLLAAVAGDTVTGLHTVITGGEVCPLAAVRGWARGRRFFNVYGPTETTCVATLVECTDSEKDDPPIGYPIANAQVYVLDRYLEPAPVGGVGELYIGGNGLARGYLNRAELTAEKFVPHPYSTKPGQRLYATGDRVKRRSDGHLEFLGRVDEQVKVRGYRIEPGEIESVLRQHPRVRDAVVMAQEVEGGHKQLLGYVTGRDTDSEELRRYLQEKLPEYMVPTAFVLLEQWPLNANGKLDRRALPSPEPASSRGWLPPSTPEEEILASIWAQVLGVERVGRDVNFFELGGDSIRSIQVIAKAQQYNFSLSIQQLFQHPTIAELAPLLVGTTAEASRKALEPFSLIAPGDRERLPAGVEDAYPVTRLQAGMIFHSEYSPQTAVYHDIFSLRVRAPLEEDAIRAALGELVERHAVLRTSFDLSGYSEPLQLVHRSVELPLQVDDLSGQSDEQQEQMLKRWVRDERERGFDWKQAPLLRMHLHRRSPESFQFGLSLHHAILDGWSLASLFTDLFRQYWYLLGRAREGMGRAPQRQYREFVALEKEAVESETCRHFWKQKLEETSRTMLVGWKGGQTEGAAGEVLKQTVPLEESVSQGLRRMAQTSGVPLKSVLLAAHLRVLSLMSGEEQVLTGMVWNGRPEGNDGERMLGLFLNTLPVGIRLTGGSWIELVQQTFALEREILPYRRMPLIELQRMQGRGRLFEVTFNFIHYHVFQGLQQLEDIEFLEAETVEETEFALVANFSVEPVRGEIQLSLLHNTAEIAGERIPAIVNYYIRALAAMAGRPEERYENCCLLSERERHQLLVEWNDTESEYQRHRCIHELFEEEAGLRPDAVAVVCEDRHLSYGELNRRAGRLAHYLRERQVRPEVRVGICMERSPEMVIGLLGILKAGGAYVPLDPSYPAERLAFMMADARLSLLLTQQSVREAVGSNAEGAISLDESWDVIGCGRSDNPVSGATSENAAYLIYTSGSAGTPKGVEICHRALLNLVYWHQAAYAITALDRATQMAATGFDASVWEIWPCLAAGSCLCIVDDTTRSNPLDLQSRLLSDGITVSFVSTRIAESLLRCNWPGHTSLRALLTGGDKLLFSPGSSLGFRVFNQYGPTENTVVTTSAEVPPRLVSHIAPPIGRPVANVQVYVLDRYLEPVPVGATGELYIGGDGLARGYLNQAELTAEKFIPHPYSKVPGQRLYRTGDKARHRADGNLEFVGRMDEQVKVRGYRIEPGEIETALRQHPEVRDAVVVAQEMETGHRRLVGYVVLRGETTDGQELRRYLQGKLPEYMVPTVFVRMEQWPLNANGKLDRRALPMPEAAASGQEKELELPATGAERILAEIWSQVLGVKSIGRHDNFFELGGDSILSIQIVARAHEAGLNLSPAQLFRHQSIAQLAAVAGQRSALPAEQGVVTGAVELTPVQRWFLEEYQGRHDHFNQAVMLQSERRLEARWVKAGVEALMRQHDALRLRFDRNEDGSRRQWNAGVEAEVPFAEVDYSGYEAAEQRTAVEAFAAQMQGSLDLRQGPLLRAVLFELGAGQAQRLLLVLHHLAVDGVSWRILLEDWQKAYGQLSRGERVRLGAKSNSYQEWGRRLGEYGRQSEELRQELGYWLKERGEGGRLPQDREGENTVESAGRVVARLGAEQTEALLEQVPAVYRTRIQEVLLTALARSAARWTAKGGLWVEMEGHGREAVVEGLDLSRTVGWFTSMYPLWLEVDRGESIGEVLKAIKEQVRGLPKQGIGYGILRYLSGEESIARRLREAARPEISFNYLGQFDGVLGEGSGWSLAPESCGPVQEMSGRRQHVLQITGHVVGGQMEFSLGYSENLHRRATIEVWAEEFVVELRGIIAHCQSPDAGGYTPSDFAMAGLTQAELDALLGQNRNIEDMYPLSPLQEGILFHTVYESELGVYFNQLSLRMKGELDEAAFEQAWNRVAERHGILRTAFVWEGLKQPQQVVYRRVQIGLRRQDWRHLGAAEREAALEACLRQDRRTEFDLSVAPLMRLSLIRLEEQAYEFTWSFHHILLDGWSLSPLMREVVGCYEALRRDERWEEAERRPYRDYIEWLQQQDMDGAERFWRQRLKGFHTPTRVGNGEQRAERLQAGEDYGERERGLGKRLTEKLKGTGQRQQVTMNTLVQGAWSLLLSRYSGEEDVMFGATVSGRPPQLAGVENMLGLFINTLPVRVGVVGEERMGIWLEQLQRQQAEVRQYEYSPLMKVQGWSEVAAGEAMFETLLVFENYPLEKAAETGSELEAGGLRSYERTNYALSLAAIPGEELRLRAYYDRNRWEDAGIERLLTHVENLLAGMVEGEQRRLREVELLTEAERRQLLVEWNDTETEYPENRCIHELFEEQAKQRPDAVAVVWEERYLSYGELNRRANQLAHALRVRQVKPEARVGICMERSPEMVIGILGILKAGGAYVPLDPSYPPERLIYIMRDSLVSVLLTSQGLIESPAGLPVEVLFIDSWGKEVSDQSDTTPACGVTPLNMAYMIYTSGSTGTPKGVMVEHRGLINLSEAQIHKLQMPPHSHVLQFASLSFDASIFEITLAFRAGATLHLASKESLAGRDLMTQLQYQDITAVVLPPSVLEYLPKEDLPALRTIIVAGESCSAGLVRAWAKDRRFFNAYGPTETAVWATIAECIPADGPPDIGRPIPNTSVYVLDRHQNPLPIGVAGEMYIGGIAPARGYLNRPELTAESFVPDPFSRVPGARLYKTGDRARYLPNGHIRFIGRVDHQEKIRGFRIEPGEAEAALMQYPGVLRALVLAREDQPGSRRLVAYVVPDPAAAGVGARDLREFLQSKLPSYLIPSAFVMLESLPLTPNGKVDRRMLPPPRDTAKTAPSRSSTQVEELIAGVWAGVLGVEQVGVEDNFFELGGHSLKGTQVISGIYEVLGVRLPLRTLFENPTLDALAKRVESALRDGADQFSPIRPVPRDRTFPLSLAQEPLWAFDRLIPGAPLFNISTSFRLAGPLDVPALELSLNEIVSRHESLRTNFDLVEGQPAQIIAKSKTATLTVIDLAALPAAERAAEVLRLASAESKRSFDLAGGPLYHASLLRLGQQEHVFLLTCHHIITDGWSFSVLVRELSAVYEGHATGRPAQLPALPVQYADFAEWQREWLTSGQMESELAYWKDRLSGSPSASEIPTDFPRSKTLSFSRSQRYLSISRDVTARLKQLSHREGCSLFMTLLAALKTLLHRRTGQDDIRVGTLTANRHRSEMEGVIGLFANTLLLRTDLSGEPTFREVLHRVRETTLGAYAHQELPFEFLVQKLEEERGLTPSALFQVLFVFQNIPMMPPGFTAASAGPSAGRNGSSEISLTPTTFDLIFSLAETSEGLTVALTFNTSLFEPATVDTILSDFRELLDAVAFDHEFCISPS